MPYIGSSGVWADVRFSVAAAVVCVEGWVCFEGFVLAGTMP